MFLTALDIQSLSKQDNGFIDESVISNIESNVVDLRSFKQEIKDYNLKIQFNQVAESFNDLYDKELIKKIKKVHRVITRSFVKKCSLMVDSPEDAIQFFELFKGMKDFLTPYRNFNEWVFDLMPYYKKYLKLYEDSLPLYSKLTKVTSLWKEKNKDFKSGNDREFEIMYKEYIVTYSALNKIIQQQKKIYNSCFFAQANQGYHHVVRYESGKTISSYKSHSDTYLQPPCDFNLLKERMKHINQRRKAKRYGIKTAEPKSKNVSDVYHYSYLLCYDRNGVIEAKIGISANPKNREKAISNTMFPFKNITLRWKSESDAKNFEQMLLKMSERYTINEGYGKEWIKFKNNELFQMWFKDQYMLCEKLATETYKAYKESHVEPKDVLCKKINTMVGQVIREENGPCPGDEFKYKCRELHNAANGFAGIKKGKGQKTANEKQLKVKLEYLEKRLNQLKS